MEKFVIKGGNKLQGEIIVTGAKNAALKALVAACMTDEKVTIHNIPLISDLFVMLDIIKELGGEVELHDHTVTIHLKKITKSSVPLDKAALVRASSMFIAPLLFRTGEAIIPNPGGCRLGARPIDRTIEGIGHMNVDVTYNSEDGYFHAKPHGDNLGARPIDRTIKGLEHLGTEINYDEKNRHYHAKGVFIKGTNYHFEKNTHTGTETMILAAVLAEGTTILTNAAQEPEIDDLINLLNAMGANVTRSNQREITIVGVEKLHGAEYAISPDRIEVVTFAIAAVITGGDVFIKDAEKAAIGPFLEKYKQTGAGFEEKSDGIRFFSTGTLNAVDVTTGVHPGFLTDWQAPWAVLMTQAKGSSIIHETVFENKLGYIEDLKKMGAKARLFNPEVKNPDEVYNFNMEDDRVEHFHAVEIKGPTPLHNAIMTTLDIRAGAAIVIAALAAKGTSTIFGVEKLDRGYEYLEKRLEKLGANMKRVEHE
ncbi:UDP-N-acetylglucosamine 1-carboxyvinyltransferase [Candidatus Roizmanbacteria bacterium]|nr:UDP-N-acetylglucosamine 1-carboxyvinyltransferase [Candidatus Roizmanbacteria bacterium]